MIGSNRALLDTNAVVALEMRVPAFREVVARFDDHAVSVVTLGELYDGAYRSHRREANLKRLRWLLRNIPVLDVTPETASVYGRIRSELRAAGTPIPENDIWIAASAIKHGVTLVSRDGHFEKVGGLEFVSW